MSEIAISTHGLTRDFPSVRAVDDLTLEVPAGIVFGFLGPNGSGKTTTVRLLLGLLEPTSGRAKVLGHDVVSEGSEIRAATGALMEHAGLYERLTAEENLLFFGRAAHMTRTDIKARVRELLEPLDLFVRRHEIVGTWSRGMKQRLAVARTLMHRPRVCFLDEPTAGLDPLAAAELREDLARQVREEGVTVFVNTHHLAEAERLCDRVGVIRRGRLLAIGRPADVRAQGAGGCLHIRGGGFTPGASAALLAVPGVLSVTRDDGQMVVGLDATASVPQVVRTAVQAGIAIEEARRGTESLETAFLSLLEEAENGAF